MEFFWLKINLLTFTHLKDVENTLIRSQSFLNIDINDNTTTK